MSRHRIRDDLRPRSAWLDLWLIIHRIALALTGYAEWSRANWRWQAQALALYLAAGAVIYLLTAWFHILGWLR
jgi:hypothetical protein